MKSGIGVEIKAPTFFYAHCYGRYFVAGNEPQVVRMIESFERDEWKDKRLQSWVIFEVGQ